MYKFFALITNNYSPLDDSTFNSPQTIEIAFDYYPSTEELLLKLEPMVFRLKSNKGVAVSIEIKNEGGNIIFIGTATSDGKLQGISMS